MGTVALLIMGVHGSQRVDQRHDAQALTTFDTAAGPIPACVTCHMRTSVHGLSPERRGLAEAPPGEVWGQYKPGKKGTFRVKASITGTATYKASKTAYKTFKVK